jgi:Fe-S-cluster containining protein
MDYLELSKIIKIELDLLGSTFQEFQYKTKVNCPTDCGKCCTKQDIYCSPFELLPLAMSLLKKGEAEKTLELARQNETNICILFKAKNLELGLGFCSVYEYRPLVCRAFGIAGRMAKNGEIELSICKKLKELYPEISKFNSDESIPIISKSKARLAVIDPSLFENEMTINSALIFILQKVLLWNSYR